MRILPIDEINNLKAKYQSKGADTPITDFEITDIIDDLLDIFLLAVANGTISINDKFGTDYRPTATQIEKMIYEKVDGASWEDRIRTWYENGGTAADIIRIAETESHRIGNETAYEAAKAVGAKRKIWLTMLDDKVRDTHVYLESVSVGINDDFYTYDSDHAPYPGAFGKAENNVGCRCEVEYS